MDVFARALIAADNILSHSNYSKMKADRYATFNSKEGQAFESGKMTLEDLAKLAEVKGEPATTSGKQELFENIINNFI
jgi:xylose isomerase